MQTHNLVQGSPEWHQHRAAHFNASDAAAMLGISSYKTRAKLLHEKHTGIGQEVDEGTQVRFDKGHAAEAAIRPHIEKLIGQELYPVTGSEGKLSASFDGITMDETIVLEHKLWNEALAESVRNGKLPQEHIPQCQQQLFVSGAEKVVFVVSDGTPEKMVYMEVLPDSAFMDFLIQGWKQFETDLKSYVPEVIKELPKGDAVVAFPTVSIQVKGELVTCNLDAVTPRFDRFLAETKTDLQTDEDFAQADVDAKASREAAKNLKVTAKAVVDQILPVSDAVRTLEMYAEKFDALGLRLEKAVKEKKDLIKTEAITKARNAFTDHVRNLDAEIMPIRMVYDAPDFGNAVKGLKTLTSMHNAIDTCLANGKIAVNEIAADIRGKLAWYKTEAKDYEALFADLQTIIFKPVDDFKLLATSRIADFRSKEKERAEQQATIAQAVAPSNAVAQTTQVAPVSTPALEKIVPDAIAKDYSKIISAFMATQKGPEKTLNTVRAYLVEFCKFMEAQKNPF